MLNRRSGVRNDRISGASLGEVFDSVMSTLESALGRTVRVERIVNSPFSFALAEADLMFATMQSPGAAVRVPLQALGLPFGGALTHRVDAHFHRQADLTDTGRMHDEIAFDWSTTSRYLPRFHGTLRMRIEASKTRFILQGDYVAPFGMLGAAFDRAIGRRLAHATLSDLIDGLARDLTNRWAMERRAG